MISFTTEEQKAVAQKFVDGGATLLETFADRLGNVTLFVKYYDGVKYVVNITTDGAYHIFSCIFYKSFNADGTILRERPRSAWLPGDLKEVQNSGQDRQAELEGHNEVGPEDSNRVTA